MLKPLPTSDYTEEVSPGHVRVTYKYTAGDKSIPKVIYGVDELVVENEYVLPHYTVARVKFGDFTNTVVTSALPIGENKTRLFVKTYRNNAITGFPPIDYIFDGAMRFLMEKTLNEDKAVIERIYPEYKDGNFITKYDDLVRKYRNDYAKYVMPQDD